MLLYSYREYSELIIRVHFLFFKCFTVPVFIDTIIEKIIIRKMKGPQVVWRLTLKILRTNTVGYQTEVRELSFCRGQALYQTS